MGKVVPARAPAPRGRTLRRLPQVGEAAGVAPEHLVVGEQVVGEEDRLGRLQVGVAGHDHVEVGLGLVEQRPLQARRGSRGWPCSSSRR